MSIWNEGRYSTNIKWVAQLLFNGGVEELEKWLRELQSAQNSNES